MSDQERKEFEEWAIASAYPLEKDGDYYAARVTRDAWSIWKAAQQAKAEPVWIPVSERLPEFGKKVLIYFAHCDHVEDATFMQVEDSWVYCLFDGEQLNDSPSHWAEYTAPQEPKA